MRHAAACVPLGAERWPATPRCVSGPGLVPIGEPEVLMTAHHTMQHCGTVTHAVLATDPLS